MASRRPAPQYDPWEIGRRRSKRELKKLRSVVLLRKTKRLRQREAVGTLLRDNLTLQEIAKRIGITRAQVQRIAIKYFPALPRDRKPRTAPAAILQRREAIGNLLRDTDLSLEAIAERLGSTRSAVQQIQIKYFPALRRPRKLRTATASALQRREAVGMLLRETPKLTLQAIADRTGVSRERVRQIQVKHFPAFPRKSGF